ncbi:armadillo-type protein [Melanogaster broomeanus]|nr:armadillo-type protein [Melanogaster broomeanus]
MASKNDEHQELFDKLKPICVPLLEKSQLTPQNVSLVLRLLSALEQTLKHHPQTTLSTNLVSYVFFPISTILRRNPNNNIPDQVLEKLLAVLAILCNSWWWNCELEVWSQIFMLCGSVIGGIEGKGKGKARDDETKEAAARCLFVLLRDRRDSEASTGDLEDLAQRRLVQLQAHVQTTRFMPIIGQTIDSLLMTAKSPHRPLQRVSLQSLAVLLGVYASTQFVPSVLPGVVSTMTRIALGTHQSKGWANGDAVAGALFVIQKVTVLSIGDTVCISDGAIRSVVDLEDFAHFHDAPAEPKPTETAPYLVTRTSSWLRASASQLHIALNTLTPLVNHPTPSALIALASMAKEILASTSLTLPQSQPLLLSWLLSLSGSSYPKVADAANDSILDLLSPISDARQSLLQALMQIAKDSLSSLPRSIISQADSRVEHIAGQVEAICRLAQSATAPSKAIGLSSISSGIDLLLGPSGGIERWGWTLLSVLEFRTPPVTVNRASVAQLLLEGNPETAERVTFPEVTFKNVPSRSASDALARMLRALGTASGDGCLYAVEWFSSTGRASRSGTAVTALWCASRLLEGVSGTSLDGEDQISERITTYSKKLERFARVLARDIAELWTVESVDVADAPSNSQRDDDSLPPTEFMKGQKTIRATLEVAEPRRPALAVSDSQTSLHKIFCLHLLAISSGILQAKFTPLLLHVLYPILHSVVSPTPYISLTALATLNFIANATSYASPANLLLSHFDYALDAVSRRLGRRWLDVDATKVLVVLVRLVGGDVVQKAGDVVEECFDRLDEYHGYEVIVEGLVEVLGEVINVIEADEPHVQDVPKEDPLAPMMVQDMNPLLFWVSHRNDVSEEYDDTDYGPAPRQGWGELNRGEADVAQDETKREKDPDDEPSPTPAQALAKQMVSRSIYFLTHGSPVIRARILSLLSSATPVLSESTLLPSIHRAWPYILNRLGDPEVFVVSAAAGLIESLVTHLEAGDGQNALARRGPGAVGTESAYTHSHRLYRSILKTMTVAVTGVHMQDTSGWEVILAFRRFLHREAHEELQACARELYMALGKGNEDAVWLALMTTSGRISGDFAFLREVKWDIRDNVALILRE